MATIVEGYSSERPLPTRATSDWLLRWVTTVDHKRIGILYIGTSAVFFLLGGIEALLIRVQLAVPNGTTLSPQQYNAVFTVHGTTMIFLVVMPLLLGFSNFIVPLQIGARDMAFPKLNALSFWLFLFGGLLFYFSFPTGDVPNVGWFAYAPLTEQPYSTSQAVDYWALGLLVTSAGTIMTGVNLVATVVKLRAPGMTWSRIPVFSWMSLITAFIILGAIPALTAAQILLEFDRRLGTSFFRVSGGGDALLWQHMFWYFGHPEVYIMALPAFGMISEIVPVFSRKPIFGYAVVVGSGALIAFYSFLVWAHHMFAVGMGTIPNAFFSGASMLIGVPTGIKVFSWLATMWRGQIRFKVPMLYACAFIANFTIGGISGIHFATAPIDWQTTDTYYVVAHFHYVLGTGSLIAALGATHYWFPKITGRMLDERLGVWDFWIIFVGMTLTFFPMHFLGLMGMPRRVYTYPDLPGWGAINALQTVGAFIQAAGVSLLLWNVYKSLRHGVRAPDNPWDGWTLEWATTSPPPDYNFDTLPPVRSARPLYDLTHPPVAAETAPRPARARRTSPGLALFFERMSTPVLGIVAFIFSEATFFGGLIITYLLYHNSTGGGVGPQDLDVPRTAVFSLFLFASSGTIVQAERRLAAGDDGGFKTWLLVTIAFGTIFIAGQATEYARMFSEGIFPNTNLFAGSFFTLTGFHGFHVIVGLIALATVAWLTFKGDFLHGRHAAIQAVATYWHFVDVVWVVVFSVVYLLSRVS